MNAYKEILVVDDEPGYRIIINNALVEAGYQTVLAQGMAEALVALLDKQHIGLVLLDFRLPEINDMNVFEIIRKYFPDKKIIITNVLAKDTRQNEINNADEYFEKSEELSILIQKVDNVLNNKGRQTGSNKIDKRNAKRIPVNILATCEKGDHHEAPVYAYFQSHTKDLSSTGGRFIVTDDVKLGQHFRMALELPGNLSPLLIDCEVVWVKKLEIPDPDNKGKVEIGVKFLKIDSPRDEEKLKKYLKYE